MTTYLKQVMALLPSFKKFELAQIPCIENVYAEALSKLANSKHSKLLNVVSIEHPIKPSISKGRKVIWIEGCSQL